MNRVLVYIGITVVLMYGYIYLGANPLEIYKKDSIKLKTDADFGKETDWELLFYDLRKELVVAADGSIFVIDGTRHGIHKFSPDGKLMKTFGQKGEGPGDLYHPMAISILDNRYLVCGEYASRRRISLFDLNGKFVKILKINRDVFSPIALGAKQIAYTSVDIKRLNKYDCRETVKIAVINSSTGNEKDIASFDIINSSLIHLSSGGAIGIENYKGNVFLARSGAGNLIVGVSNSPEIKIYSPDGQLVRSFRLQMQPMPMTDDFVRQVKSKLIDELKESNFPPELLKQIKNYPFEKVFDKYLPYYRDVYVDSDGNILVFKWTHRVKNYQKIFQVYKPNGEYVCETVFDCGPYAFDIDYRWKVLAFSKHGLFGLFQLAGSDDISLRLVKVKLK